jgi:SET domain-containing protein
MTNVFIWLYNPFSRVRFYTRTPHVGAHAPMCAPSIPSFQTVSKKPARRRPVAPPHPDPALGRAWQGRVCGAGHRRRRVLIEYVGEIISWDEAQDRHPHDPKDPTTPSTSMSMKTA